MYSNPSVRQTINLRMNMQSDKIVIEAPLSFAGSAKRIWRISGNALVRIFILLPLVFFAWCFVLCWYAFFGVLIIPYRLIRRSSRKQKRDKLRHYELVDAAGKREG